MEHLEIREIKTEEVSAFAPLVADFRVVLKSYKGIRSKPNVQAGLEELQEYLEAGFPCYGAWLGDLPVGYVVCKVDEPCVWVESLYAKPEYRRQGVATKLFQRAETLARSYGEETVYNNVHPNNHGVIQFLRKQGYTVLNLLEVRKAYQGEILSQEISVGEHVFDY